MTRPGTSFLFLNIGHLLDHFFMLIFATVAALSLPREWGMSYGELIPYATPGFIAFGVFAIPAGWIADRWSREGMMVVFFLGIGAASVATGFVRSPLELMWALGAVGLFAAIYHPVGIALVIEGRVRTGVPLAVNGVFGNLGVASAALVSVFLIESAGWRLAFIVPGVVSVVVGFAYVVVIRSVRTNAVATTAPGAEPLRNPGVDRHTLVRVFGVVLATTALGGLIFQSMTFALPKVLEERLATSSAVGLYGFGIFAVAALAQLVVGFLVDRVSVRSVFAGVAALQVVFLVGLALGASELQTVVWALLAMLVIFGQIPINDVLLGRLASGEWRSRAFAARSFVTFGVAATAVPVIALVHESAGFPPLFAMLGTAALGVLIGALLLPAASFIVRAQ